MFTLKIKFPDVSNFSLRDIFEECERLGKAGWTIVHHSTRLNDGRVEQTIEREIQQLYLVEVHWNQHFLGFEPTEISVVFQNSLFPMHLSDAWFLNTSSKWVHLESDMFPGFWYEVRTNIGEKALEIRVFCGRQLGEENLKRFFLTLSLFHAATKIVRELHQSRMAAGKGNMPEMYRHHNEILETLSLYLPR
ncbi:MAG: hypothetical protein HYT65_02145 [Candidatus Yanofskybacteria bacterium]|nr:hypothetical protein [Candidatus Yanofskybacteria bacterium]